jgi:heme/copper-type cytochrome/quinol oxidase subunit 4
MSEQTPSEHFEHAEHAEHALQERSPFLLTVSVTIAILAVVAASVGSLETIETAAALAEQNAASLLQNKTSDQWAFFQAKSIKHSVYELASRQGGEMASEFSREAERYKTESAEIKLKAEEYERQVDQRLHQAERHEHRHYILTTAVTLLHVAIAITTIAIIMKGRRWPWHAGLALGAAGAALAGFAYL